MTMATPPELTEPEARVMRVLWDAGSKSAKRVVEALGDLYGYSPSTTYTLIYRCIKKNAIRRVDPGFILEPQISREEVQDYETRQLVDKLFDGPVDGLFTALVDRKKVSLEAISRMKLLVDRYEQRGDEEGE